MNTDQQLIDFGNLNGNGETEIENSIDCGANNLHFTFDAGNSQMFVSSAIVAGNYTCTMTMTEQTEDDQTVQTSDFIVEIIDVPILFNYEVEEEITDSERPTMYIEEVNFEGLVEVRFNHQMIRPNITNINETVLELYIVPADRDTDLSKLQFTWNTTAFSPLQMTIQLFFENPIYVSAGEYRDILRIKVLEPNMFIASKSMLAVKEETIISKNIAP